jgi:hypothetical protein
MSDPAINRFAISLLDKTRKSEALNEEVMIDRQTSEILVKSTSGVITSYNKQARLNSHNSELTILCYILNLNGNMYRIDVDSVDTPALVPEDTSLILLPMTLIQNTQIDKFLLSVDADALFVNVDGTTELNENQPLIEYDITFATDNTTQVVYNITDSIEIGKLNMAPIEISYPEFAQGDDVNYDIILNSLKIKRNGSDPVEASINFILHNILFVIK